MIASPIMGIEEMMDIRIEQYEGSTMIIMDQELIEGQKNPELSIEDIISDRKGSREPKEIVTLTYKQGAYTVFLSLYETEKSVKDLDALPPQTKLGRRIGAYDFSTEIACKTGNEVLLDFSSEKNLYIVFTAIGDGAEGYKGNPLQECLSSIQVDASKLKIRYGEGNNSDALSKHLRMLEIAKDRQRRFALGEQLRTLYLVQENLARKISKPRASLSSNPHLFEVLYKQGRFWPEE